MYVLDTLGNPVQLGAGEVAGDPNNVVIFPTPNLFEDVEIYIRGSRDNFVTSEPVGTSPTVLVRANSNLVLNNSILTIDYDGSLALSDINIPAQPAPVPGTNNFTQASVT